MLKVTWHHFAVNDYRREAVEGSYSKKLLELCETEDRAKRLHAEHVEVNHPFTLWHRFNCIAANEAVKDLLPSERLKSRFTVQFQ
jgi:hypothetical protein